MKGKGRCGGRRTRRRSRAAQSNSLNDTVTERRHWGQTHEHEGVRRSTQPRPPVASVFGIFAALAESRFTEEGTAEKM